MPDLETYLEKAIADFRKDRDSEKLDDRLEQLEQKADGGATIDGDALVEMVRGLPLEQRRAITEALAEAIEDEPEPEEVDEPQDEPENEPEGRRRTRAGRKKGGVYDFDVDDDGRVIDLRGQPARIYQGEDEPDRVDLPDEPEEGDEPEPDDLEEAV